MPRARLSTMTPTEFRFLRDLLGLTQQDVADLTGVSSPRVVAAWDAERNPSENAANVIREQYARFQERLTDALARTHTARIAPDGQSVIELHRYTTDEALHAAHPEYPRVRHYDAFLRALTAALIARGVRVNIV